MELRDAYRVLEIAEGANEDAVRDARKMLAKVWHPDRHANDPELEARAQQKLAEINEAFETIRAAKYPAAPPAGRAASPRVPTDSPRPPAPPPTSEPRPGAYPPPRASAPPPPRAHEPGNIELVPRRRVRTWVILLFAIALGAGAYFAITRLGQRGATAAGDASTRTASSDGAETDAAIVTLAVDAADTAPTDAAVIDDPPPPTPGSDLRKVGTFRSVELAGDLEVEIVIGKPARVEVTGEAALLARVSTVVNKSVLLIDAAKGSLPDGHHVRVAIVVPDLASLVLSGSGTLRTRGIANDQLEMTVPGAGTLAVAGTTKTLRLAVTGPATVQANDLTARIATVRLAGTGTAQLVATEKLDAQLEGTGIIQVTGNPPNFSRKINGTGLIEVK